MSFLLSLLKLLFWPASIAFIVAIFFTYRLAKETKWERYWVFFLISALAMGIYHFAIEIPGELGYIPESAYYPAREVSEAVWAFGLAYASYGIYKSMRKIRKKLRG
ncbi:MAG: hypothetical protein HYX24_07205 [Candidatus Aenigmarchaeota archaeon]|nr:hypothetical protein [Candidatus Aenigmarchaeota archaeon]